MNEVPTERTKKIYLRFQKRGMLQEIIPFRVVTKNVPEGQNILLWIKKISDGVRIATGVTNLIRLPLGVTSQVRLRDDSGTILNEREML